MRARLPNPIRAPSAGHRAPEVLAELKAVNAELAEVDQDAFGDDERTAIGPLAASLADERVLGHADRAVRLVASVCIAHVLRLCAPDAPYTPLQLGSVFGAIISSLRILADNRDAYHTYAFCLAESLATFKSVALLLDVPPAAGGEDLQRQLVRTALDLAPSAAQSPVRTHLLELVQTLVDESDGVSPVAPLLIDALSVETTPGASRALAAAVLATCGERLAPGLASAISRAFSSYAAESTPVRLEALRTAHARLLPLVQHSPSAAAGAVALVEEELRSTDAAVRSLALEALAEYFFPHSAAWVTEAFAGTFNAFLARADDRTVSVRLSWARIAPALLARLSALRVNSSSALRDAIAARLLDTEAKIREAALASLAAPAVISATIPTASKSSAQMSSSCAFTAALIADVAQRARDRVEDVRLAALAVLCNLAKSTHSHLSASGAAGADAKSGVFDEKLNAVLFAHSVDALFSLVGSAADRDLRVLYSYFIEHSLLAPRDDTSVHARFLVAIYGALSEAGRTGLSRWLRDKARAVKYFAAFVALAKQDPSDARLAVLAPHLADCFRAPLDALNMLRALADSVFAGALPCRGLFERLAEPGTTVRTLLRLQTEAAAVDWSAIDARIQPYLVTFVFRRAALLSISAEAVAAAASLPDAALFVEAVLAEFPSLAGEHCAVLEGLVASTADDLCAHAAHLSAYARYAASAHVAVAPGVLSAAKSVLAADPQRNGARQAAKAAASVLVAARADITSYASAHPADAVRWQALAVFAAAGMHTARLSSFAQLEVEEAARDYTSSMNSESNDPPSTGIHGPVERLDLLDQRAQCAVLAVRTLREALLAMGAAASKPADADSHLERLRTAAPALVSLACAAGALGAVAFSAAKALVALVPRPTLHVLRADMARAVLGAHRAHPARMAAAVLRMYGRGRAGLVHVAALFLHWPSAAEGVGAALADVRSRDHRCEALGTSPADMEVGSHVLRRWEHVFVVALVLAALVGDPSSDRETVSALVDAVATESSVSFLFDAVVALKGLAFDEDAVPSDATAANRRLYRLSEQAQAALRARASQHRWALRAVAAPIVVQEASVLHPLSSAQRVARNVQRSYLAALDASSRLGHAHGDASKSGNAHNGGDGADKIRAAGGDRSGDAHEAENVRNVPVRKSSRRAE